MSHRSIDLLPVETRQRAEAGQRVRRTIGLCLAIAALAGTAATWSRLRAEAAEGARVQLEAMAQQAIELETQAAACGKAADDIERLMEDYRAVALPMPVSTLVAGLAEEQRQAHAWITATLDVAYPTHQVCFFPNELESEIVSVFASM